MDPLQCGRDVLSRLQDHRLVSMRPDHSIDGPEVPHRSCPVDHTVQPVLIVQRQAVVSIHALDDWGDEGPRIAQLTLLDGLSGN
jgi:hypothetical protein